MAKSEKCSSQKLLIKPGQYIGDCKSAQTDLIITKKTMLSCANVTRCSICSDSIDFICG